MGWFSRKEKSNGAPERPEADDELTFLSQEAADRFRATVRTVLAEDGYEVTVHRGHVVTDDGRQWGLWNVAAVAHNAEGGEGEWPEVIREHFGKLLSGDLLSTEDLTEDEYLANLRMRLVEAEAATSVDGFDHAIPWADGVVRLPVLDLPDTVATPMESALREHGELGALMDRAWRNTAALVTTEELVVEQVEHEGRFFHCVLGDSFFTASLALVLPDLVRRLEPGADVSAPIVFSVPFRHQLNYRVVDSSEAALGALLLMPRFSIVGFEDSPGPVSPHTYLWADGEVTTLTRIAPGEVALTPGPHLEPFLSDPEA